MQSFTETTKQAFELYNQGKVKQALSMLTPGSQHHEYLKMVESIKAGKPKEYKKVIKEYKDRFAAYSSDELFDEIVSQLVQLEEFDFLKELGNNVYSMSFNHSKPYYAINTMEKDDDKILGPNEWKVEDHYKDEDMIKRAYSDDYTINNLHKSLWNKLDFSKLTENAIENFISNAETLGVISEKSFIKRIATILKERYARKDYGHYYEIPSHYVDKLSIAQLDELAGLVPRVKQDSTFKVKYFEKQYHSFFQDPEYYQ